LNVKFMRKHYVIRFVIVKVVNICNLRNDAYSASSNEMKYLNKKC
jgi:hypothetical protein